MSENSGHSPDDNEADTKATENHQDLSKSEAKLMLNQTDTALLEDEEMPTYISVSSTSRRDDSDVVATKQQENMSIEEEHSQSPYHSDDQAASSVYVLSSGEETDQPPFNDEDDEDEYGDSDDMENLELDNDLDPEHQNRMKHLMDEEDDDDDDEDEEDDEESPRQMQNDNDEDISGNYETEYFDRISDDFILNKKLKARDKEKSLSLQDLSVCKNNMYAQYNKKEHINVLRQNYLNIPQNAVMYSMIQRRQMAPTKYHHIESKVKLYIKDIKEQNRRSIEKHIKDNEDVTRTNSNTDYKNDETEITKSTAINKTIKDYAEKTIKELEIADIHDRSNVVYNAPIIMVNGQDSKNNLESIQQEHTSLQNEVENNEQNKISDDKIQKQNGAVDITFSEKETRKSASQSSLIQNGHQETPPIVFNLRTLSYEEYMHGTSVSSQKTDLEKKAHQEYAEPERQINAELMDVCEIDNNDACPIRIENIKSIRSDEAKENTEQIMIDKLNEEFNKKTVDNLEVITLKDELNQKTIQYNNLCDTYQKQLAENLRIKQELKELKKSLMKYEKENKPPEQKVASIQTDFNINSTPNVDSNQVENTGGKLSINKISSSTVASTLSSIEEWTDSACNISMKPPETAKTLHSDDSVILTDGTPKKTAHSLSRAFITSSRILQTLSNITQGKAKPESPLVQNPKKRLNENATTEQQNDDGSCQSRPSSSKKRKLADILGPSSFLQPFRSLQTTTGSHSKLNEMSKLEYQLKSPNESVNKQMDSKDSSNINTSQVDNGTSIETKAEENDDPEDNVKCFVYNENENSKDRSFLIIAEESAKYKVNEKGRIRECGPYLLGNIEVRMSEINGTINIWGKEISEESVCDIGNETENFAKVNDEKKYCWQKSPQTRFNGSNLVCSTSKKSKTAAKFELTPPASNFSCLHSTSFNVAKQSCSTNKTHTNNLYNSNACASSCGNCDLSRHRREWLRCKQVCPQEKLHSCCAHNVDTLGQRCSCSLHKEKQKYEDTSNCNREKLNTEESRNFSKNLLEPNKQLHENNPQAEDNEFVCKYHSAHNHSLHNATENFHENDKYYNISRDACAYEPLIMNSKRECSGSCSHSSPRVDEEEPLILPNKFSETAETRRRRLSGKRVRGILMDLLRGCGECYSPNTTNNSKDCSHKKEVPYLTSCPPQVKISPCASPEPPCSNLGQSATRCCHAYAQRIESQLEEFRMEMEKVRSRSDAILNMLNMLHSVETN